MSRVGALRNLTLSVGFVLLLATPAIVGALLGFPDETRDEKRTPAAFPSLKRRHLAEFPGGFERWFDDHFGLRLLLIRFSNLLRYEGGVSSSPDVILGKHDFLFFAGDGALANYRRTWVLDTNKRRRWREVLEQRWKWFSARGIHYLVVINPDKETVYPEEMPEAYTRLDKTAALDDLVREITRETSIPLVVSTDALLRAKAAKQLVFHRTDTHWNGFGRFAAYQVVWQRVHDWFPAVKGLPFDALNIETTFATGGDLSAMLGIPEYVPEQQSVEISLREPRGNQVRYDGPTPENVLPWFAPVAWEVDDGALPRAVIIGDSFMNPYSGLSMYLKEHFSRTVYGGHHDLDLEIVTRERPDVVIEGFLERFILSWVPDPRRELALGSSPTADFIPPRGMDAEHPPGRALPSLDAWEREQLTATEDGTVIADAAPSLRTAVAPFVAKGDQTLYLGLTAFPLGDDPSPIWARLHWAADGQDDSEARSVLFPVVTDGKLHRYAVQPSVSAAWQGNVSSLGLELPRGRVGAEYALGGVELLP